MAALNHYENQLQFYPAIPSAPSKMNSRFCSNPDPIHIEKLGATPNTTFLQEPGPPVSCFMLLVNLNFFIVYQNTFYGYAWTTHLCCKRIL